MRFDPCLYFLANGHRHHSLGHRPRTDRRNIHFGQRPYSIQVWGEISRLNMAVGQTDDAWVCTRGVAPGYVAIGRWPWIATCRRPLKFATVIDGGGNFGFQTPAVHNAIDVAMLKQKLARLKSFRKLDLERRFDGSGASEADQSFGFGKD